MIKWSEENRDMAGTEAAMRRAAQRARDIALLHGQPLAIMRNGKVTLVPAAELPDLFAPAAAAAEPKKAI